MTLAACMHLEEPTHVIPSLQAAATEVEKQFPDGVDVLINNAGILSDHVTHLNMCAQPTFSLRRERECSLNWRRGCTCAQNEGLRPFMVKVVFSSADASLTLQGGERSARCAADKCGWDLHGDQGTPALYEKRTQEAGEAQLLRSSSADMADTSHAAA